MFKNRVSLLAAGLLIAVLAALPALADAPQDLRDAAKRGDTDKVAELLAQGVPVDPDAPGRQAR